MLKKTKLRRIPVLVQLYPKDLHEADLMKELKIDRHNLDKELLRQPSRYAFWAALYATVSARVALLQEKLDQKEAELFIFYARNKKAKRVSDIKFHVLRNSDFQELRARLRKWQDSERTLKYAERAFTQRLSALQTVSANVRREWKSEEDR
jgi:hypothetical protein